MATTPNIVTALRQIADMVEAHPDLADILDIAIDRTLVPVSHKEDPREVMAQFIRAGKASGAKVTKGYDDNYGNVDLIFGDRDALYPIHLHVYANREQVCERVVTGTTEVTREVPDPDALAAVPKVTVTETVETVEWNCLPLLDDSKTAVSA